MITNYIGVDLGTTYIALATYVPQKEGIHYVFVKFPPDLPSSKLHACVQDIVRLCVCDWNETRAFVEGVFMGLNARTFARMTRVSHSVQIALSEEYVEHQVIDPKAWRKVLFGNHMTKKEDGLVWAEEYLTGLDSVPKSKREHLLEAAMIAIAGRYLIEPEYDRGAGPVQPGHVESLSIQMGDYRGSILRLS